MVSHLREIAYEKMILQRPAYVRPHYYPRYPWEQQRPYGQQRLVVRLSQDVTGV